MSIIVELDPAKLRITARKHKRGKVTVGVALGTIALLAGVPMPGGRNANELEEQATELQHKLDGLQGEVARVDEWETGGRTSADRVHREFRAWFSHAAGLLETRNHLLQVVEVLGLTLTGISIAEEDVSGGGAGAVAMAAPQVLGSGGDAMAAIAGGVGGASGGFPVAAKVERCRLDGTGDPTRVLLLGGMVSSLTPRLRLVSLEVSGEEDDDGGRSFHLEVERYFEKEAPAVGASPAMAGMPGMAPAGEHR